MINHTSATGTNVRLRESLNDMTSAERKASEYILQHSKDIINMSITELAQRSQSSESTIVRLCKKLRLRGYQELRVALAQDLASPVKQIHEKVTLEDSSEQIKSKVFQAAAQALSDTESVLSSEHMSQCVKWIESANNIVFFGIGASGVIALDAFYRFSKLGISCSAATEGHSQLNRAIHLNQGDVVIGISHSGRTRDVVKALYVAKNHGAKTIAITQFGHSPITEVADIILFTSSRETAFRSEAMASRIAQSVILDSLFVATSLTRYEEVIQNYEKAKEVLSDMRIEHVREIYKKNN